MEFSPEDDFLLTNELEFILTFDPQNEISGFSPEDLVLSSIELDFLVKAETQYNLQQQQHQQPINFNRNAIGSMSGSVLEFANRIENSALSSNDLQFSEVIIRDLLGEKSPDLNAETRIIISPSDLPILDVVPEDFELPTEASTLVSSSSAEDTMVIYSYF